MSNTKENEFIPVSYPLKRMMNFWREKSIAEARPGQFNLQLYLDYLSAQDQPNNNVNAVKK